LLSLSERNSPSPWLIALTVWPADSEARAERPAELLERYRPLLRYDAQEEFYAQPVSLPPASARAGRLRRQRSHANFSAPGDYGRPFPDPTDEAGGDGRSVRPAVSEIDDQSPGWVSYPGPWGETEASFVPGESPSPPGPRFQESRAWSEPSSYHQRVARECGSGAPGRPAQTAALAIAAALALAGLLLALRRRRALRQNPVDDRS